MATGGEEANIFGTGVQDANGEIRALAVAEEERSLSIARIQSCSNSV